jgi:hypothetical protein
MMCCWSDTVGDRSSTPPRKPRVVARVVKTKSTDSANGPGAAAAVEMPHLNNVALP